MSENNDSKSVSAVVAQALEPVAKDFAANSGSTPGRLSTGEALAGVGNIAANRVYQAVAGLDALLTFKTYVAGWRYLEEQFVPKVGERLARVPLEDRVPPPTRAAGLILEAAKYTSEDPPLEDMFAELLAGTMDRSRQALFHPGYVEVIKQMTSDEARIVKFLGDTRRVFPVLSVIGQSRPPEEGFVVWLDKFTFIGRDAGVPISREIVRQLDSLCRLGLVEIPFGTHLTNPTAYDELKNAPELSEIKKNIETAGRDVDYRLSIVRLTQFGQSFHMVCCKSVAAGNGSAVTTTVT